MRAYSLLLLRISLGLLLVIWGVDKIINVDHAILVSDHFYLGLIKAPLMWNIFGILQTLLGLAVVLGLWRKFTYPVQAVINGATMLGVWKSIIDPMGLMLEGTNVLFYPSLIVFASCLVLWAFRSEDQMVLDKN
ncbi:DoxX family membrane protein [Microbulbifer sp. 2201CG32-9]|uniref:DoxX family membrane protein n=1 Tax=unclassified Microbulbifer TaxID=2619833 RepID=UPI00345BC80D